MMTVSLTLSQNVRAEIDGLQREERKLTKLEVEMKKDGYEAKLKRRYGLGDGELKRFHFAGLNNAQITIAAQLAQASGKVTGEIAKMRLEEKMPWGEIAKKIGVPPKQICLILEQTFRPSVSAHSKEGFRANRVERRVTPHGQG